MGKQPGQFRHFVLFWSKSAALNNQLLTDLITYWLSILSIVYIDICWPGILGSTISKSAACLCCGEEQQHPGLYWQKSSQHAEGSDPSPQFGTCDRGPGALCLVLGSTVPAGPWHTIVSAGKGSQDGSRTGTQCTRRGWVNFNHLMMRRCREGTACLSSEMHNDKTCGSSHKLHCGNSA